jgi:DNA repair protein RecN (Recombination protein N)
LIERFYLKEYLSFEKVEMQLSSGLVVFTGPSGSGKSILMNSILASVGLSGCEASLCESQVSWEIKEEEFGIENDEINVFKHIKKEKSRYFVNNQSVSKKNIQLLSSDYLRHLSLKDFSDFENENLLEILDLRIAKKTKSLPDLKAKLKESFLEHKRVKAELTQLEDEEKRIVELKEFAAFEIAKIEDVNPKSSEDEELMEIKKELSKKEKVLEKIELANTIFESEHQVSLALEALDVESSFFDDAMNQLRAVFDTAQERFESLDEVDIEDILNRIEELSNLKRRYGSIEEALAYKEQKKLELAKYENIEIQKESLVQEERSLRDAMERFAQDLSALRQAELSSFEKDLNSYLKELYLRGADVELQEGDHSMLGKDIMVLKLQNTELQKISTGEFNRLRLAVLALKAENMTKNGGVLMLDEIDANLSGEESMSVAKVLRHLSKHFQIFVISHQPQLTSMGDQHFLVYKDGNESFVAELNHDERVEEIARIISGENVSKEAKSFAKELLEASKCAL